MPTNTVIDIRPSPGATDPAHAPSAVRINGCRLRLGASQGARVEFNLDEFRLEQGERLALTGPSGCGKSTLLNLVSGLLRPDEGEIEVLGTRLDSLNHWRLDRFRGASLGFIFQSFNLLESFSALENVLAGMRFGRVIGRVSQRPQATQWLERVGLSHRIHSRPSRLSMGERQRVAIARALANRPALLLADEPTGALDPETAAGVFALIQDLCIETGCSLLFVTHDLDLAVRLPRRFDCRGLIGHRQESENRS